MSIIAIDGAARRNGKPDCISAGGIFVMQTNCEEIKLFTESVAEIGSTNQRGELQGLVKGLQAGLVVLEQNSDDTIVLVTDSEYVYNCITKEWYVNWRRNGWVTASGNQVKSRDLWEKAALLLDEYHRRDFELTPYHVKGHVLTIGDKAGKQHLQEDSSGLSLYKALRKQPFKVDKYNAAIELFITNCGFEPPGSVLQEFLVCNGVADFVASKRVDEADLIYSSSDQ